MSARGNESRDRILQATLELAAENGLVGTAMSQVIRRSGMSASSIYWHFADKQVLFAETLDYGYEQWRAAIAGEDAWLDLPWEDAVRQRFAAAVAAMEERPEFWQIGLMLTLSPGPDRPPALDRFLLIHAELFDRLESWYRQLLRSIGGSEALAAELARFHMATTTGLFASSAAEELDQAALAEHLAGAVVATVRAHLTNGGDDDL